MRSDLMFHVEFLLSGVSALIVVQSSTVQSKRGLANFCSSGTNRLKKEIPIEFIETTIAISNNFSSQLEIVPRFHILLKMA